MLKQHRTSTAFALKIQFISYGTLALLTVLPSAAALADTTTSKVSYEYDPTTGLVNTKTTNPDDAQLSVKTTYAYNIDGNVLTKTVSSTATGLAAIPTRTTEKITYDTYRTTPISFTNAIGQVTTVQLNTSNLPTYIQNLNGLKTTRTYSHGQLTTETRPDQSTTIWQYYKCDIRCVANEAYFIQATTRGGDGLQSSPITTTYFDSLQREVRKETQGFDGTSIIVQNTEYDNLGRVYRKSRPYYKGQAVKWTTISYDELGRVVDVTGADGSVVHTAYDGYRTTVTNPLGQVRTQISNSRGQIVQVIDTMGSVLRYEYDAQGNLLKTIDPNGNTVSMFYNPLGQKIGMVDPDMGAFSYVYDVLGQLKQQTDSKNQVTTLNYDLLGRLINRTEPDLKSDWTYDSCTMGKGLLCKVTSDNGYSKAQSYDTVSRPSVTTTTIDTAYASTITYDAGGRISTQSYPTGLTVKYIYTTLGYLKEVRNKATNALYWQANAMDAEGHLTQQTYGNNIVTQQVFDPATGRVKNVYAGAGNAVQNLSYTYDARGNMLSRNDANQNLAETFLYDPLNRLTSNTVNSSGAGVVTQSYTYDNIGNIATRSDMGAYTYGVVNARPHAVAEIVHADGGKRQFGYDAIGNLTQETELDPTGAVIAAKGRTETYTSFNMPISLAKPGTTLSFVYGADHQRIKQIMPSGTTIYVHPDSAGGLAYEKELKSDGTIEHKMFITAGGGVVALVTQKTSGTSTMYFHRDHLDSTTAVTNESGAVVERFAYEPFGKRRTLVGAVDSNGSITGVQTDRGFTNQEHLDELGLIHMNGRVYDPVIGRFMSADPTITSPKNIQSFNRYSYVYNNPLVAIDPTGFSVMAMGGCYSMDDEDGPCEVEAGSVGGAGEGTIFVPSIHQDTDGVYYSPHPAPAPATSDESSPGFSCSSNGSCFEGYGNNISSASNVNYVNAGASGGGTGAPAGGGTKITNTGPCGGRPCQDISAQLGLSIVTNASLWKGTPYATAGTKYAGANSTRNIGGDCSGSTCQIFAAAGLPFGYRSSSQFAAAAAGGSIPFRRLGGNETRQAGDILLFAGHVAIYVGAVNGVEMMWTARGAGRPYTEMPLKYWGSSPIGTYRYQVPSTE